VGGHGDGITDGKIGGERVGLRESSESETN